MDKLTFLTGDEPGEVEETVADAPLVETPPEPVAEPEPEPAPEPAPEPPTPAALEPGHVPISAMLDEREKRQALEKQLAQLKAKADPPPPLDATEQLQAALYAQNLRTSRRFAEARYGARSVETVHDWAAARCDADPAFNEQIRSSDDPYEAAMQAYNREQVLTEVGPGDLDAFRAWKAATAAAAAGAPAETTPTPTPATATAATPVPRSLVNASGNGALGKDAISAGPGEAHAAIFRG
jgi:hypothetical protein